MPTSPKLYLRSRFSYQNFVLFLSHYVCYTFANLGILYLIALILGEPIPVAARSKAWVFGRSLPGKTDQIPPGHGCLSLVTVVLSELYATDRSLVLRSPTDCGASLRVI